jgi:hypothetical protein
MTPATFTTNKIRTLNREFRRAGPLFGRRVFDGLWLIAAGVQSMGPSFTGEAITAVQKVDALSPDSDPNGEHDFGSFEVAGQVVFWQIDYLQRGTPFGAEDPADNTTTCRTITIMLGDER